MKEISLSAHRKCKSSGLYVALVDDCDFEAMNTIAWSPLVIKGSRILVYAYGSATGRDRRPLMHREIWKRAYGEYPIGEIDHKDHGEFGGLDNRRCNLRLATRLQQFGNSRKKQGTVSIYRGVYWHRRAGKWAAQISVDNRPKYLGLFDKQEDAGLAYDIEARLRFGEFARLNFPSSGAA